jgi:glutathione S-transferase
MYRLYQMQDSGNCYKIRLLLSHLGIPCETIGVDILKGESRTNEFLALNPNGRVPLLAIDSVTWLPESNAILCFLAKSTRFLPDEDALAMARVMQWLFFEQYSHEPYIATSRFWRHILGQPDRYQEQLAERYDGGVSALQVMDHHLTDSAFFAGDTYTIADIALYAYTHVADQGGFDLAPYPAINNWLERITQQPGFITMDTRI